MNGVRHVITQGEHMVSTEPDLYISTLLGSCVACCLWDPIAMVGGMNHMLLTQHGDAARHSDLAGINAMEMLINDLQKRDALRSRLQAKVFGGAQMFDGLSRIGAANCSFVLEYLAREGIICTGQSLGGDSARYIAFWPRTGVARQKIRKDTIVVEKPCPGIETTGNDLELF